MKRILILISILCYGLTSIAQETKSQLVTRFDVIRNETAVGGNTKTRIANAYQELSDGMIGVYPVEATGTDTYSGPLIGIDGYNKRIFFVTFQNNNTGASTLNINSIGSVAIQKDVSGTWTALSSGDILAGKLYRLFHDGTRFQIDLGGAGGGGSGTVESVTGNVVDNTDPANPTITAQPLDADLTAISGLSPSNDDIIQRKAGVWTNRTMAQLKSDLNITGDVWVAATGTNTYIASVDGWTNYNNKTAFFVFQNTNSSTATININSIGAAPIRKWDGVTWSALASGDIETDRDYRLSYDNTNGWFRLEAISPAFGSGPLVMGVATNTDAPIAPIFGSTDGHSLRIASGTVGFGPIPLDDPDATSGSLPATNISFSPTGGISTGNVQNAIAEVDAEKTALVWTENEQTGDYTLDATDVNKTVEMNSSSTRTLTLPSNATESIPIGHYFVIHQRGSSAFNIAAGSGATAVFPAGVSAVSPGQGLSITAKKISTNGWQVENGSAGGGGGSGTVTTVTGSAPIVITGTSTVTPNVTITDAAADGTTKGAATFTANDFNASSGNVSIDYTNGQSATSSTKGFVTSTDYTSFRNSALISASVSTAGGTITLDMDSYNEKVFAGSASFATSKTIALSNSTNAVSFNFKFEITNVAGTLVFPSTWRMSDSRFDTATDTWTPTTIGIYRLGAIWDQVDSKWDVIIAGPFN